MAFPICDECASSIVLCPRCREKERRGEISELDVLVSTILKRHGATGYEALRDLGSKLVIFASESEAPIIIGTRGNTAQELSKKLGRRVVVLVRGWNKERIIASLARPSRIVAVNRVFQQDGTEVLKMILDRPLDEETAKLAKELAGDVEIDYERRS